MNNQTWNGRQYKVISGISPQAWYLPVIKENISQCKRKVKDECQRMINMG